MSKPSIEEILAPKPEARPRIYAYSIDDKAHKGLLKVRPIQVTKTARFSPLARKRERGGGEGKQAGRHVFPPQIT